MDDNEVTKRIIQKLDRLDERLDRVDITLVKQEANLQEHMRRSEANEKAVHILESKINPITSHILMVNGAAKLLSLLSLLAGLAVAIKKLLFF